MMTEGDRLIDSLLLKALYRCRRFTAEGALPLKALYR
jgi:hypothetical protein